MDDPTLKPWQTRQRRTVYQQERWLTVELHTVELPDGTTIDDWAWIKTPNFVNVALVMEDGRFLVFQQTKYAVEGATLAPVGGYIEDGEDVLIAAQRETREETGCEADTWISLGAFPVDGNRGAGIAHLMLALGGRKVTEPDADDLEDQQVQFLTRAELERALYAGDFKALSWATCMALALLRLDHQAAQQDKPDDI